MSNTISPILKDHIVSGNGVEAWFATLPSTLSTIANTSYGANDTMKIAKVNLNKQSLFARLKSDFRGKFAAIYERPQNGGGEKAWQFNDADYARVMESIEVFINNELLSMNTGKWNLEAGAKRFAFNTKTEQYDVKRDIVARQVIDLQQQHLANVIDIGVCRRKLEDFRIKNPIVGDDDQRIINMQERLAICEERLEKLNKEMKAQNVLPLQGIEQRKAVYA